MQFIDEHCARRNKRGSVIRIRSRFLTVTRYLDDEEFKRAFRMKRETFNLLLSRLQPYLARNERQAACSSRGVITPAVRLAITIRMLAGGSYHDQMMCWGVGRSMTFRVFLETLKAVNMEFKMPGLPLNEESKLQCLANGFQASRNRLNPLYGCVGALDGIAIAIRKPPDEYMPRNFYCRKGMYALPVQAVVDSTMRFLYMSCRCTGSTHDATAFDVSDLAERLKKGEMKEGYWIDGDAAYVYIPGLLTPWSKSALTSENGVYADSFNFYHSSHRIHVEQAFGMLVQRWGLFWKPVKYHINDVLTILSAAMRLHNFCIENDGQRSWMTGSSLLERQMETEAFTRWWAIASSLRTATTNSQGTRRDLENSDLRTILTNDLRHRGITRPALS